MEKLKPPMQWYGGKTRMVDELLKHVPSHECYLEAYGGSGALLFAKDPCKVEAYNDLHSGVVTFYRVLRDKPGDLILLLSLTPYSREEYVRCWHYIERIRSGWDDYDDVEYARCFFVIARQSFAGKHCDLYLGQKNPGGVWSRSTLSNNAYAWVNSIEGLPTIHNRLRGVQIENKPALETIRQFDSDITFMYLDPPYVLSTRKEKEGYNYEMSDQDHEYLLCTIKQCKGMVLLSGYDNPLYNDLLSNWHRRDIKTKANIPRGEDADLERIEVLWWNEALDQNNSQLRFL